MGIIREMLNRVYFPVFGNVEALNRYLRISNIKPELDTINNSTILDIGCADGHFTHFMLARNNVVYGADLRNHNVSGKYPGINFTQLDARYLPYKDSSFNFVFCSDVFEHIPEYEKIIPEISRVLMPDGKCLISTVEGIWKSPMGIRNVLLKMPDLLRRILLGRFNQSDLMLHKNYLGHVNFDITKNGLAKLLDKNGIEAIKKKTYCHSTGSLFMEIYYALNESIRYFTFPFLRLLLFMDKFKGNGYYWQFYIIGRKKDPHPHSFTIARNKIVNRKICSDLTKIRQRLLEEFKSPTSLILVGGFGRGEGSVLLEDGAARPVNDYDVVIVSENKSDPLSLKELSREMANETGVRSIDLIPVNNADVSNLPYTMFNYDMKNGGYVFGGDEDILENIPNYDPASMPLIEGRILLFNRMICLLESYSEEFRKREPDTDEKFFLTNQTSKALLACCDALLISRGMYHHSYRERCRRFSQAFRNRKEIVALIQQATDFKVRPGSVTNTDAVEYWFDARDVFVNVLSEFCGIYYNRHVNDIEALEKLYKREGTSLKRKVANIVGLKNNAGPRKDIELLELGLLYAINRESYANRYLKFARSKLNEILEQEYSGIIGWEFMRKECVRLWFEYLH